MITVAVNGKSNKLESISAARDYLVVVEDSFIHDDVAWMRHATTVIVVEGDGKRTSASLTAADGEMWEVEADDFQLFANGELL